MVKSEGSGEGDARGEAVVEDDSQSTAPGGTGKRPHAVAGWGQVGALRVVPSRFQPGLGEKHELYVQVCDKTADFCSFFRTIHRTGVE